LVPASNRFSRCEQTVAGDTPYCSGGKPSMRMSKRDAKICHATIDARLGVIRDGRSRRRQPMCTASPRPSVRLRTPRLARHGSVAQRSRPARRAIPVTAGDGRTQGQGNPADPEGTNCSRALLGSEFGIRTTQLIVL
jgi:hypothetical protein